MWADSLAASERMSQTPRSTSTGSVSSSTSGWSASALSPGYSHATRLMSCYHNSSHNSNTHTLTTILRPSSILSGFNGARDSEWQWHQLDHIQICTLTHNSHHSTIQYKQNLLSITICRQPRALINY